MVYDHGFRNGVRSSDAGVDFFLGYNNMSLGGFIFFDATYIELDVDFIYGHIKYFVDLFDTGKTVIDRSNSFQLHFSLIGKYPIVMEKLTFFPLLGISYTIFLVYNPDYFILNNTPYNKASEFNRIGILSGLGFETAINTNLYFRSEIMIHYRFPNKTIKDAIVSDPDAKATAGLGPRIKVGVGYRF